MNQTKERKRKKLPRPPMARIPAKTNPHLRTVIANTCGLVSVCVVALAIPATAHAQLFDRAFVIRNARIVTMDGSIIENGTILTKGGRIIAVGKEVKAPFLSSTFDADGKTVTPGLIDAFSALGRIDSSSEGDATSSVWDSFDRYSREEYREALRNGVTTIYLTPGGGPGIKGKGAVIKLAPGEGGTAGKLLKADAALAIDLGSEQSALARLKNFNGIRKQFRKAKEYREALEDYEEDLEEYLEELEKRREKEEKEKEANGEDEPAEDKPAPAPEEDEEKKEEEKPAPDDSSAPDSRDQLGRNGEKDKNNKKNGKDKEGEKKDDEEEEELKKPEKPTPDRKSEVLLEAIDRKLPVRIRAHRSADIFNALDLGKEFTLDIILEGGSEAYLVAKRLALAEVPVVLGPVLRTGIYESGAFHRHSERNAAALSEAGVLWTIGSGADEPLAARFVGLNAQLAAAHTGEDGLRRVTIDSAKVLGLSDKVGRIARGMAADLVVWTADPNDPASTVDKVYVAGKLVFDASAQKARGGGS